MIPIRVLVVDDSARMREAILKCLTDAPDCRVVGMGTNGLEALELARALLPELIVLDISMPVMGGIEALTLLKRDLPDIPVVMVSAILEQEMRDHALGLGAYACLEKGQDLWEGLTGIVSEVRNARINASGNVVIPQTPYCGIGRFC